MSGSAPIPDSQTSLGMSVDSTDIVGGRNCHVSGKKDNFVFYVLRFNFQSTIFQSCLNGDAASWILS